MGARTVTDVLAAIPGIETFIKEYGYLELVMRGGRQEGQRIKFLLNGHSMNPPRTGQPSIFLDDLCVENIKRIEIIRGPGSALYGTNAFNGVINIITKDADDLDGYEVIVKGGSHHTFSTGVLWGKTFNEIEVSGYAEYSETDGSDSILSQDAQTVLDQMYAPFGIPAASLAPGKVNAYRRKADLNLDVRFRDFTLKTKYLNKVNGPYIGANYTLNHDSEWDLEYAFVEGEYAATFNDYLDLALKFSWDRVREDYYIQGSPEGFHIPLDLDGDGDIEIFPDGRLGRLATSFDTFGGECVGTYRPMANHTIIAGAAFQDIQQFQNIAKTNFDRQTIAALDPGEWDTSPSFEDNNRTIWALFFQHQWQMIDTLGLTLGVRHDEYSDFGSTTNPRAALVWGVRPNFHLKVLYGQAFLAPSFHETYLMNNPLVVGSKDLKPTTIRTFEIGTTYALSDRITSTLTYFYNKDEDVIVEQVQPDPNMPSTFVNSNGDIVQGVECELKATMAERFQGYLNYTFRETELQETHDDVPFVTAHLARFGLNAPLGEYVTANIQTTVIGERPREPDDPRPPVPGYALVDTTLTAGNIIPGLELFISVHNVFDKEYEHPSIAGSFPEDYPMPGRTVLAGIRYAFGNKQ
jgi:iron complex outermembrane receptor protein